MGISDSASNVVRGAFIVIAYAAAFAFEPELVGMFQSSGIKGFSAYVLASAVVGVPALVFTWYVVRAIRNAGQPE